MLKTDEKQGPGADEEANFIAAVKRIREEWGWSQGELAKRMSDSGWEGFHQTTISRIEKGERPVRLGEARGLAKVLGAFVGQMILPVEEAKPLRDLELTLAKVEQAAKNIAAWTGDLLGDQLILKYDLEKAEKLPRTGWVDDWLTERLEGALDAARKAVDYDPLKITREAMETFYGIDQGTP